MGLGVEIGKAGLKIRVGTNLRGYQNFKESRREEKENLKHLLHGAGNDKMVSYI